MRTQAPALLPIFRSQHQAQLLATLLIDPDREHTITELAQQLGMSKQATQAEVERLVRADVLRDRRQGRNRLISANPDHPAVEPLTQLALMTFGPHTVVAEEFSEIPGAETVLIFGSWAARYEGHAGPPPADIDVLVIGATRMPDLFDAADRAQKRLGTEVNPQRCTREQWQEPGDRTLLIEIQQRPYVTVFDAAEHS